MIFCLIVSLGLIEAAVWVSDSSLSDKLAGTGVILALFTILIKYAVDQTRD